MEDSSLNNLTNHKRQSKRVQSECKICGAPALYSYLGVISCCSCRAFFKRNGKHRKELLKCDYDGNCEINLNNRRICSYCRLMKCFKCGMEIERLRSSYPRTKKTSQNKVTTNPIEETSTALVKLNQLKQFPTLNLLDSDQSTLSIDQWNLISNLSHCYDEYSGISIGERFVREQNALPIKLRLKSTSLIEFTGMALDGLRLLYEKNRDFVSLLADDRSILLQNTFKHTGCLCTNFILHKVGIMDYPTYYDAIAVIANASVVSVAKRLATRLDFDIIIHKLLLAILSFSTTNYTVYSNTPPTNVSNIKRILHIQDTYIELIWRYLLYKYNFEQAVKCFSDILRYLFIANEIIVKIEEVQWYTDQTNSLVQQTEQILILND